MAKKIAIILPTYNEAKNIEALLKAIFAQKIPELRVYLVDDSSPDGTAKIVENLTGLYPITLIKRPKKLGLGSAYITGFKQALADGADLIFEMDADCSHAPSDVPRL